MKKYELTGEVKVKFGVTFKRIRALISKTKTIKYLYHADVSLGHLQSSGN